MMKILYVDVYAHAINFSNTNFSTLVNKIGDVKFYGPSFISEVILKKGLLKYISENGPFDFLIVGPNTALIMDLDNLKHHTSGLVKFNSFATNEKTIENFYNDFFSSLPKIQIKNKICSMFLVDQYAINFNHLKIFEKYDFYFLTPDDQFFPFKKDLPEWIIEEEFYQRKKSHLDDVWKQFLINNKHKVINCMHYVSETEFIFRNLLSRKYDIVIPGILYTKRLEMKKRLEKLKYKMYKNRLSFFLRLGNKLKLPIFSEYITLNLYNLLFRRSLINSKFAFTDGGGYNAIVRKFFEIPANGCLLFCRSPHGFNNLGFKKNEHYVEVTAQNLHEKVEYYHKNINRAQIIVNNARRFTFNNHSLSKRALQIKKCLKSILKKEFYGSEWKDGKYIINRK